MMWVRDGITMMACILKRSEKANILHMLISHNRLLTFHRLSTLSLTSETRWAVDLQLRFGGGAGVSQGIGVALYAPPGVPLNVSHDLAMALKENRSSIIETV